MKRIITFCLALALTVPACGTDEQGFTDAQLAAARNALPSRTLLTAPTMDGAGKLQLNVLGAPAAFPQEVLPMAMVINGVIGHLLDTLEWVTQQPPTVYNSDTLEFVWGPFDDDDTILPGDTVYVYVKQGENDEGQTSYVYALIRGYQNDMAKNQAVIWGTGTPDPNNEDHGVGVIMLDFEANRVFEDDVNPNHGRLDEGRFAALYMKGPDEDNAANEVGIVIAAFRNFKGKDDPEQDPPGDMDYIYGAVDGADNFDFMNFRMSEDLDASSDAEEYLDVQMAFWGDSVGRAEATGAGGDVPAGSTIESTECWDTGLLREHYALDLVDGAGNRTEIAPTEGEPTACSVPSLEMVPGLDEVPSEWMDALADVAENGIPE